MIPIDGGRNKNGFVMMPSSEYIAKRQHLTYSGYFYQLFIMLVYLSFYWKSGSVGAVLFAADNKNIKETEWDQHG